MKNLIEISKIVTKKKVKKIEIFDEHSLKHKNSKFNEFYEALQLGRFKNDRDAAKALYDCSPTDDKYRQLKSRFRKRLLNTLFFLDVNTPATSNYNRAYFTVNKDWTLVKILLSNNAIATAAGLAKHILTIALKFKFADVIVNSARILREYASLIDDEKEFEVYDQYAKQYQDVLNAEIRSEELLQRVQMNYHKPPLKSQDLKDKIDIYCDALVSLSELYESPVIYYNMFMVWAYRYEMLNDYNSVVEVCERAEKYIHDNPIYYRDDVASNFYLKKMTAYLHLRDFKNGKITADASVAKFPVGSDTWFMVMEQYFLLSMHTANYVNALAVFNETVNNVKFKRLNTIEKERWKVYEVYLNFIVEHLGANNAALVAPANRNFRLSRFLSEQVVLPRELRPLTGLALIAQVLFFCEKKSFNAAQERIEKLKMFAYKNLKKEEFYRMIQFIRLLQQLVKADFKSSEISLEAKYFSRLEENPFKYRGLLAELEVLPLEYVWEVLKKQLE
jgi:hypothetical protein